MLPLVAKNLGVGGGGESARRTALLPGSDEALIIHLMVKGRDSGAPAPSFCQAKAASGGGSASRFLPAPPQLSTRGPLLQSTHRYSEAGSARPDAPHSPAARTPGTRSASQENLLSPPPLPCTSW